jgi:CAAX protease family protein
MQTGPEIVPGTEPAAPTSQPAMEENKLIAPVWHTAILVIVILLNSFAGSSKLGAIHGSTARILVYASTFITQSVLILIVWFGIRKRGVRMRDLVGGRWETVEDFLLDVAIAVGFLVSAALLLFGLRVALGTIDLHNLQKSVDTAVKTLGPIAPHTFLEAGLFLLLSVFAGLFEEIIFRGYFQRQFIALSRNVFLGIVASGVLFGLAHGYQGPRMMVVIGVYGMFFGVLAHLRKSLRPGMMAHALQDSLAGITLFRLVR